MASSLTHQDCLELREHGFPQEYRWGQWSCEHGLHNDPDRTEWCKCWGDMLTYAPTFGEVVAQCGDDFESLEQNPETLLETTRWTAFGRYFCCSEHGDGKKIENGSTPEEAVARLWLALNPKKV